MVTAVAMLAIAAAVDKVAEMVVEAMEAAAIWRVGFPVAAGESSSGADEAERRGGRNHGRA